MIVGPSPTPAQLSAANSSGTSTISHLPTSIYHLLCLVPFWLLLIYHLGAQWSIYEQYNYGWAVPFLCAFLIWKRVQAANVSALVVTPARSRFSVFLLCAFCLAVALYAPTRLLHEANPIWRLTSWLWALEV